MGQTSTNDPEIAATLCDLWFFSDEDPVHWMGQIVDMVRPGTYLVRLFAVNSKTARPLHFRLATLQQMASWSFYQDKLVWEEAIPTHERRWREYAGEVPAYRWSSDSFD